MSTHNVCFHREIRKNIFLITPLILSYGIMMSEYFDLVLYLWLLEFPDIIIFTLNIQTPNS